MTRSLLVPPLLLFQLGTPYAPALPDPAILVTAERAFARDAAERGTRAAFLAHMGEGSVVFEPGPVDAREVWEAREPAAGLLSWEPEHASIAASGDLGFTTGPWEFRSGDAQDDPVAFGEYATVWRLEADGAWRFAADIGIGHGPHPSSPAAPALSPAGFVPEVAAAPADVLAADRAFASDARRGVEKAYRDHSTPEVLLLREGSETAVGLDAAARLAGRFPAVWEPGEAMVSAAGDLGVVYGVARAAGGSDPAGYLRVWRLQPTGWRIVLDVATLPAPAP